MELVVELSIFVSVNAETIKTAQALAVLKFGNVVYDSAFVASVHSPQSAFEAQKYLVPIEDVLSKTKTGG